MAGFLTLGLYLSFSEMNKGCIILKLNYLYFFTNQIELGTLYFYLQYLNTPAERHSVGGSKLEVLFADLCLTPLPGQPMPSILPVNLLITRAGTLFSSIPGNFHSNQLSCTINERQV